MSATKTYKMLKHVYGSDTLPRKQAFEWHQRFRGGRESVEDDGRSGRPQTSHIAERRKVSVPGPTRGLLATDHVILNHGQVTWTTPELAPPSPNYHTTPTGGRFSSRQI
ncbi:hypothetical protein TNCV_4348711 [Trichonephila clavipes]|nr:hypothetical protein TNCV_4348711 [Trichonephila clavipes]